MIILLVYVDDILVARVSLEEITEVKVALHKAFTIKDMRNVRFFLGIEVCQMQNGFLLS